MKNGNDIQQRLANGKLYQAVREAAYSVKDSHDYDLMTEEQRQMAIVCALLEKVIQRPEEAVEVVDALSVQKPALSEG